MDLGNWIKRYSVDCQLKYNSISTRKNYKSCVKSFLEYFIHFDQPKSIPTQEIKEWLLLATTNNTRKHRLCAVKSFFEITVGMPMKLDKIPYPPKEKKLPRIINQEELKNKILSIPNKKHKAILALAYCCSLRVSEVINLKIVDIDGKQRIVSIRQSKGKKDRYTGISESCLNILREYFTQYRPKEYLFEGQYAGQYTTRSCEEIYHKYIDLDTSFHYLRHAGITSMIESGTNILAVGVAVGHSNPKTTQIYFHSSPKFLSQIPSPI